jgi:hypothetical protein
MTTLLNHNNKAATINVNTSYDKDNNVITTAKTWSELNDSEKQDIAGTWIKDHIHTNVNQVMELLSQSEDHEDFEDYMNLSESKDFEEVSTDHINDLTIDDLIELSNDLDNVDHVELFKEKYLADLLENTSSNYASIENIYNALEITFLQSLGKDIEEYNQLAIEKELLTFFKNNYDSFSFDDLDTCITELGINFDGYLKSYHSDLVTLILEDIDLEEYGNDNNLDPEYDQAYEFYSVSDHFSALLPENCSDLLGLTVWARFCCGQAIVLDHEVQLAAFKVLSDCSYENY